MCFLFQHLLFCSLFSRASEQAGQQHAKSFERVEMYTGQRVKLLIASNFFGSAIENGETQEEREEEEGKKKGKGKKVEEEEPLV